MPRVTVLLPVYNSEKYISECIDSIIEQTYTDWEMLIIDEFESSKACTDIIKKYCTLDPRIKLIKNDIKLGLAESLNKGMRLAKGEYIARMDADDLSHPDRLKKQVEYMDSHPDIIVLGTYQHHFGVDTDWVHKPPIEKEQCKSNMLFFCDLCHSTLMLRKKVFIENELFYNNKFLAEDFELWGRVICHGEIANLPEVLGEYRVGEDNITLEKKDRLHKESGELVAKAVKQTLGYEIPSDRRFLFCNWRNDFFGISDKDEVERQYRVLEEELLNIYYANKDKKIFDETALLRSIRAKWFWARVGEPFNRMLDVKNNDINSIFRTKYCTNPKLNRLYYFWKENKGIIPKIRKILKKLREYILK